jgi:hAT family C-terminal dimerisation region
LLPAVEDAWTKLDHYYQETDKSSIYSSAVILAPRSKLSFLQRKWAEHPDCIEAARTSTARRFQEYFNTSITSFVTDSQSTDIFDTFKFGEISQQNIKDELADYLSFSLAAQNADPVKWWIDHAVRFPILSHLALDILAIPATSAEAERAFSRYISNPMGQYANCGLPIHATDCNAILFPCAEV